MVPYTDFQVLILSYTIFPQFTDARPARPPPAIHRGTTTTQQFPLLYHYDQVFTDSEIFGRKKFKKKSENSKEKHFG